mgnify:FL=1
MNTIVLNEIPIEVYQVLYQYGEQYGQVKSEDFACVIDAYHDAYEYGHLTMICHEYVIIGDYAIFCSDCYKAVRYRVPKAAYAYYLPLTKMSDGKIGNSCSCLGFPSGDVKKVLYVWKENSLISPLANLHESLKEVVQILDEINKQSHCTGEDIEQISNLFIEFFKQPTCSE